MLVSLILYSFLMIALGLEVFGSQFFNLVAHGAFVDDAAGIAVTGAVVTLGRVALGDAAVT